jgi:uncharacterized protein YuzE
MKITYDRTANAVYIFLTEIPNGGVAKTYPCDLIETNAEINLDFDSSGRLIGIEILDADKKLPKEILANAEIIG